MDTLSLLLTFYPVKTQLDTRCYFSAPWEFRKETSERGVAPYHFVAKGTAWVDVGDKNAIPLDAGDIVVFPKGATHRIYTDGAESSKQIFFAEERYPLTVNRNVGDGPMAELICGTFEFNLERGSMMLDALPSVILVRTAGNENLAPLRTLLSMLTKETDDVEPGMASVVNDLSTALFAMTIRAWLTQNDIPAGLFSVLTNPRLEPALKGMLESPEKQWTLEEMCEVCGISRATYARIFRKATGSTPVTLLTRLRMARAARELSGGGNCSVVSEAVGYHSEAAFNRVFKRSFGVGPGQYRRQWNQAR